jgi:predicted regulator of Ras-like GTPase activity (Roadblock/LC7/MglB family)
MAEGSMRLSREAMAQRFTSPLQALQREHPSVIAAQVCTSDGFVVSQAHSNEEAGRRLAAMVSSLHAVGAAMVEELALGDYGHLSVEASLGKCMLFAVPGTNGSLLLAAIADDSMLWGQFLTACRTLSDTLGVLATRSE